MLIKKVKIGEKIKIYKLADPGIKVSLFNNFTASAIACNKPYIPTTLGPLLRCIAANIFLSNTVKKATANKIGNIIGKFFNKSIFN